MHLVAQTRGFAQNPAKQVVSGIERAADLASDGRFERCAVARPAAPAIEFVLKTLVCGKIPIITYKFQMFDHQPLLNFGM
jgi:hypothetical protein